MTSAKMNGTRPLKIFLNWHLWQHGFKDENIHSGGWCNHRDLCRHNYDDPEPYQIKPLSNDNRREQRNKIKIIAMDSMTQPKIKNTSSSAQTKGRPSNPVDLTSAKTPVARPDIVKSYDSISALNSAA